MSDTVERIVEMVCRSQVRSVTVTAHGLKVTVRRRLPRPKLRSPRDTEAAHVVMAEAKPAAPPETPVIRSRRVGVFRHLDPPFAVGDAVQAGQTVGIIESMKIPSDVRAETDGVIIEVLVEDGAPVEFDQPLFVVAPTPIGTGGGEEQ